MRDAFVTASGPNVSDRADGRCILNDPGAGLPLPDRSHGFSVPVAEQRIDFCAIVVRSAVFAGTSARERSTDVAAAAALTLSMRRRYAGSRPVVPSAGATSKKSKRLMIFQQILRTLRRHTCSH